jgi:hypothetical protein
MGGSSYNSERREKSSEQHEYRSKTREQIFVEKKIHEKMDPRGIHFREARDSEAHPAAKPIQFYLDVTGSMRHVPHEMIVDGLPKLMSSLIQNGAPDAALMFGAIGDHETDRSPLQIGQFESGDEELDGWLTKTWLESGGGSNPGESYLLAWYFAAFHVRTDAWEKRQEKGFLFTIGDESCLPVLPMSAVQKIMGEAAVGQGQYTMQELLDAAQKQNHVYHIHLNHASRFCDPKWKQLLGNNLIEMSDHREVSHIIANVILSHVKDPGQAATQATNTTEKPVQNFL